MGDHRGEVLWRPAPDARAHTRLGAFMDWLGARGRRVDTYDELLAWSLADLDGFWSALREHFDLGHVTGGVALADASMPGAVWFPGSTWNYAEEALRHTPAGPALIARSQTRERIELGAGELRDQVARCRAGLLALGVQRGDRVAAYLPNIPEAMIGFLATASLGAVWTSCPPEFGVRSVVDRFAQVEPVVLLATDGYRYGAKDIDRRADLAAIRDGLPSVRHVVHVPYLFAEPAPDSSTWAELTARTTPLAFEQVPFDHPLYILYSSGTTGLPKAIVHGHGGIVCEHVKATALQCDLGPADRFFWFSTTGWMMWNFLASGLLAGSTVVLYDGDPGWPDLGNLWRMAAGERVTFFGTSAPFIVACRAAGLAPGRTNDLGALRAVGSTGAPLPPDGFRWVYEAVGRDLLLSSISGGTDVCTAFVGGCPLLPVRAGEIACRFLGADVRAVDADGHDVIGEQGEMVVAAPMPSMPVGFWGDADGSRLRAAYYTDHPGRWTHGDWITIQPDGSSVISGRADATLNRGGVRLGTAEIYAVVDDFPEVADSLVVFLEDDAGGPGELLLFVVLGQEPEAGLDDLRRRIAAELRRQLSPRHTPDDVIAVPAVPRTLSGKKLEIPVKRILQGAAPDTVLSRGSLADPAAVDAYVALARDRAPG
jgi:acetoacetyl-CoA synthetase